MRLRIVFFFVTSMRFLADFMFAIYIHLHPILSSNSVGDDTTFSVIAQAFA